MEIFPILTIDIVMFTILHSKLHIFLPNRDKEPFLGCPSLVGGYVHTDEDMDTHAAAKRILYEKVSTEAPYLEQLATFSGLHRDPRGWSATVVYISMIPYWKIDKQYFYPIDELPQNIGFDHSKIILWAIKRIQNKSSYSSLPLFLMPEKFTLTELQNMYECLMGTKIDKTTFRYKIKELNILESTGKMSDPKLTNARPAELFKAKTKNLWLFKSELV